MHETKVPPQPQLAAEHPGESGPLPDSEVRSSLLIELFPWRKHIGTYTEISDWWRQFAWEFTSKYPNPTPAQLKAALEKPVQEFTLKIMNEQLVVRQKLSKLKETLIQFDCNPDDPRQLLSVMSMAEAVPDHLDILSLKREYQRYTELQVTLERIKRSLDLDLELADDRVFGASLLNKTFYISELIAAETAPQVTPELEAHEQSLRGGLFIAEQHMARLKRQYLKKTQSGHTAQTVSHEWSSRFPEHGPELAQLEHPSCLYTQVPDDYRYHTPFREGTVEVACVPHAPAVGVTEEFYLPQYRHLEKVYGELCNGTVHKLLKKNWLLLLDKLPPELNIHFRSELHHKVAVIERIRGTNYYQDELGTWTSMFLLSAHLTQLPMIGQQVSQFEFIPLEENINRKPLRGERARGLLYETAEEELKGAFGLESSSITIPDQQKTKEDHSYFTQEANDVLKGKELSYQDWVVRDSYDHMSMLRWLEENGQLATQYNCNLEESYWCLAVQLVFSKHEENDSFTQPLWEELQNLVSGGLLSSSRSYWYRPGTRPLDLLTYFDAFMLVSQLVKLADTYQWYGVDFGRFIKTKTLFAGHDTVIKSPRQVLLLLCTLYARMNETERAQLGHIAESIIADAVAGINWQAAEKEPLLYMPAFLELPKTELDTFLSQQSQITTPLEATRASRSGLNSFLARADEAEQSGYTVVSPPTPVIPVVNDSLSSERGVKISPSNFLWGDLHQVVNSHAYGPPARDSQAAEPDQTAVALREQRKTLATTLAEIPLGFSLQERYGVEIQQAIEQLLRDTPELGSMNALSKLVSALETLLGVSPELTAQTAPELVTQLGAVRVFLHQQTEHYQRGQPLSNFHRELETFLQEHGKEIFNEQTLMLLLSAAGGTIPNSEVAALILSTLENSEVAFNLQVVLAIEHLERLRLKKLLGIDTSASLLFEMRATLQTYVSSQFARNPNYMPLQDREYRTRAREVIDRVTKLMPMVMKYTDGVGSLFESLVFSTSQEQQKLLGNCSAHADLCRTIIQFVAPDVPTECIGTYGAEGFLPLPEWYQQLSITGESGASSHKMVICSWIDEKTGRPTWLVAEPTIGTTKVLDSNSWQVETGRGQATTPATTTQLQPGQYMTWQESRLLGLQIAQIRAWVAGAARHGSLLVELLRSVDLEGYSELFEVYDVGIVFTYACDYSLPNNKRWKYLQQILMQEPYYLARHDADSIHFSSTITRLSRFAELAVQYRAYPVLFFIGRIITAYSQKYDTRLGSLGTALREQACHAMATLTPGMQEKLWNTWKHLVLPDDRAFVVTTSQALQREYQVSLQQKATQPATSALDTAEEKKPENPQISQEFADEKAAVALDSITQTTQALSDVATLLSMKETEQLEELSNRGELPMREVVPDKVAQILEPKTERVKSFATSITEATVRLQQLPELATREAVKILIEALTPRLGRKASEVAELLVLTYYSRVFGAEGQQKLVARAAQQLEQAAGDLLPFSPVSLLQHPAEFTDRLNRSGLPELNPQAAPFFVQALQHPELPLSQPRSSLSSGTRTVPLLPG